MAPLPPDPHSDQKTRAALEAENAELRAMVAAQSERIAALESELADLRGRLSQDSKNSSAPPSRDNANRRERRAAEAAERKAARSRQTGGEPRRPASSQGLQGPR